MFLTSKDREFYHLLEKNKSQQFRRDNDFQTCKKLKRSVFEEFLKEKVLAALFASSISICLLAKNTSFIVQRNSIKNDELKNFGTGKNYVCHRCNVFRFLGGFWMQNIFLPEIEKLLLEQPHCPLEKFLVLRLGWFF